MATPVTLNGNSYSIPAYGDSGYAQGAGNLSSYLVALATGVLTLSGGTFTLTAPITFAAFGITMSGGDMTFATGFGPVLTDTTNSALTYRLIVTNGILGLQELT